MGLSAPLALPIIGARPSEVRTLIRLSVAEIMKIEGERERERGTQRKGRRGNSVMRGQLHFRARNFVVLPT